MPLGQALFVSRFLKNSRFSVRPFGLILAWWSVATMLGKRCAADVSATAAVEEQKGDE